MKILHTIQGMSPSLGGPSTCTYDLLHSMYKLRPDIELLTVNSKSSSDIVLGNDEPWLVLVPNDLKTPLQISRNLKKIYDQSDYDLYHSNGLWTYTNHKICSIARKQNKPYVISPHGMLYPNALKINYWKKYPMLKLWFNKDIYNASCFHVTCTQEAQFIRDYGYRGPIAVVGNAVVIPDYATIADRKILYNGRKIIGFLGRLHPIKRVENVLYALASCPLEVRSGILFQIIGAFDKQYEEWLRAEVVRLDLTDCVEFVGFVCGEEKYRRLQNMWALMVPSESENFGMIVPEALVSGTPVFASIGTPWEQLNTEKCGWWMDASIDNIASVISQVYSMNEYDCISMGIRGRRMVEQNFLSSSVAEKMWQLYDWLLNKGSRPDFVYLK